MSVIAIGFVVAANAQDADAVRVASATLDRMGGGEAWDNTRLIGWRIFGRDHVWDKWTGDYRYEDDSLLVLMNVTTKQGKVWKRGARLTNSQVKEAILERTFARWTNDSYWLVMPFKLFDPGVSLSYLGVQQMENGAEAEVLEMTFDGVGLTPENKYHVFVDRETRFVSQWSFFRNAGDSEPQWTRPWKDWKEYGEIWLSTGRNKEPDGSHQITNLYVSDSVPEGTFSEPAYRTAP